MLIYRVFLFLFSLGMPLVTLLVGGRLAWCTFQLVRISRYALATLSALCVFFLAGLLFVVGYFWFEYDLTQANREIWTDLRLDLLTAVPFYGVAFALWRLSANLQSVIKTQRLLAAEAALRELQALKQR